MAKVAVLCSIVIISTISVAHRTPFDINGDDVDIIDKRALDDQLASVYERDLMHMDLPIRKGLVRFALDKPQMKRSAQGLRARSIANFVRKRADTTKPREVCPSFSDWVTRTEAEDPYGNRVTVLEHVPINGTLVRQYFYETFCHAMDSTEENPRPLDKSQHRECLAIDKGQWNSRCRENYIWTYGKVLKEDGKLGWSVIAIRGSCSCGVSRKSHKGGNFFDEPE